MQPGHEELSVMESHRFRRLVDPATAPDEELRSYIDGETSEQIVRRVSDAFAEELAALMKRARSEKPER